MLPAPPTGDPAQQEAVETPVQVGVDDILRPAGRLDQEQHDGDGDQCADRAVPGRAVEAVPDNGREHADEQAHQRREYRRERTTQEGKHRERGRPAGESAYQLAQCGPAAGLARRPERSPPARHLQDSKNWPP